MGAAQPGVWDIEGNRQITSVRVLVHPHTQKVRHYDELLPNGMVSRHRFETTFHLRPPDTLQRLLDESGYVDVSFFGDYAFGDLGETSKRLITCAMNPT